MIETKPRPPVIKSVIVVGASSGLGKAVAEQLATQGTTVFALARHIEDTTMPPGVVKITCNIRDLESIDATFSKIDQQTGQIDALINCAGRGLVKPFEDVTRDEIMDVLGINLKGNIYMALEAYKRMLPFKAGQIVNVGSTSSLKARELETIYCASKWGLRGFTESLRLAAQPHGIRVIGVYPGGMKSDHFWQVVPGKDLSGYLEPTLVAKQLIQVLQSDLSLAPAELVLERGQN